MPRIGKQNLPRENNLVSFRIPDKVLERLKAIQGKRSLGATCQDALASYFGVEEDIESEEKQKDFKEILGEIVEEQLIRVFHPRIAKIEQEIHEFKNPNHPNLASIKHDLYQIKKALHLHLNPNLEERNGRIQEKLVDNVDNQEKDDKTEVEEPVTTKTPRKPRTKKMNNDILV